MKRIDRVYHWLLEHADKMSWHDMCLQRGFNTHDIADGLRILRNNVSFELGNLLRMQQIVKVKGRPIAYIPKVSVERALGISLSEVEFDSFDALNALVSPGGEVAAQAPADSRVSEHRSADPFSLLIGFDGSLKTQVEQAKAAILYPPSSLHTLITGPTGVGKSLFASVMFNYACFVGRFDAKKPLIVFNCADYAMNPQLLMAHIFGHIKGAFTGAGEDKEGLVDKANGGMLFLDEIHRLPPEGQEMVFYFMDTGTYSRLGETERRRTASVLLVGATTENLESAMLKTFIRRIPIIIHLPTFERRSTQEKISLLKFLLNREAQRIQKPIRIDVEAMKALIGNTSFGNIGQMKSNVQLVCANGFLHCLHQDIIDIRFRDLPSEIKNGLFHLGARRDEMQQINDYLEDFLVIQPGGEPSPLQEDDQYEPTFNLYNIIEDKVTFMQDHGLSHEEITRFILLDISIHLNTFYMKFQNNAGMQENILKVVNEDILHFSQQMKKIVERELNHHLTERFLLAVSLHLTSFLARTENRHTALLPRIEHLLMNQGQEYQAAKIVKQHIEDKFGIDVPVVEEMYLTLLIGSLLKTQQEERVAVLVVMHGSHTASSMASVAQKLLGEGNIDSIDMPLDISPKLVLDQMRQRIKELNCNKGVLLLVDMGSLNGFGDIIMQETGIQIRTLTMASTPTVIEAVRKSAVMGMELDDIYFSLCDFKGYGSYRKTTQQLDTSMLYQKVKAILCVCSTGQGTAEKLKTFVDGMLCNMERCDINVIAMPLNEVEIQRDLLLKRYEFIMSLGIADPRINAPFLPLETLFSSNGEAQFTLLVQRSHLQSVIRPHAMVRKISEESMTEFLTYLNPKKVVDPVLEYISELEKLEGFPFDNGMKVSISVHIGSALERMVQHCGLKYDGSLSEDNQKKLDTYQTIARCFQKKLAITLDRDELSYILEMVAELSERSAAQQEDLS